MPLIAGTVSAGSLALIPGALSGSWIRSIPGSGRLGSVRLSHRFVSDSPVWKVAVPYRCSQRINKIGAGSIAKLRDDPNRIGAAGELAVRMSKNSVPTEGVGHFGYLVRIGAVLVTKGGGLPERVFDVIDAIAAVAIVVDRGSIAGRIKDLRQENQSRIG